MKILSLANEIRDDVTTSGMNIKRASTTGFSIAERNAKIYKLGNARKYYNATRSISNKIIKSTRKRDIPYVAGAIGMLIPFPFACPIFMGLGFLIRYASINLCSKNKQNKAPALDKTV